MMEKVFTKVCETGGCFVECDGVTGEWFPTVQEAWKASDGWNAFTPGKCVGADFGAVWPTVGGGK